MKKILSLLLFFSLPAILSAQKSCGLIQAQEYVFSQDPTARQRVQELLEAARMQGQLQGRASAAGNYTIPVVFHVLHMNGPENISDAQIQDQIDVMNRDFNKQNPDTTDVVSQFQNLIGNAGIEFRLATLDPNGDCTNGITRHYDANTVWTVNSNNYIYTWPRSRYMNIYVVKNMPPGVAAYAYYPGTVPAAMDAIVVQHDYVGSMGTASPGNSRVITHEAGHWLNLEHLWGSTNQPGVACGDDGVNDTPITKGFTWCNLSNPIDCTPGVAENIQNYMDYAYCQRMFTPGQCTRMLNALTSPIGSRNNLWTPANLASTGALLPVQGCPPVADFVASGQTCVGSSAYFTNGSYGTINTWEWSSAQANGVSNQPNGGLTFTVSGPATVKLKVSNSFGSDSVSRQILVLGDISSGTADVVEGFETGNFSSDWLASTPQYGSGFNTTSQAAFNGGFSAWVDNFNDNPNGPVSLFSPAFALPATGVARLTFFYAYAQRYDFNADQFKVYFSTDCGDTWNQIYAVSGSSMGLLPAPLTTAYVANDPSFWQQVIVNLPFALTGSQRLYFKFEFTPDIGGAGNNFFIDDINLETLNTGDVGLAELQRLSMRLSPNPFSGALRLSGEGLEHVTDITLYDISGRVVADEARPVLKNQALSLEGLEHLSAGVYFMKVAAGAESRTFKAVKQ